MPNDILGGRIGTQASRINTALIGGQQGTSTDIARAINEPVANVSAQLSWLFSRNLISRRPNYRGGGRWIYFFTGTRPAPVFTTAVPTVAELGDRTFGIEMEIVVPTAHASNQSTAQAYIAQVLEAAGVSTRAEYYNHSNRPYWKVVTDASIGGNGVGYGVEVVNPVLSGAAGEAQVEIVCNALVAAGALVNRTCGMHVHHGAAN